MSQFFTMTEAVSIALHGIVLISKSDTSVNVTDIGEATGSSKHHVAKIMQRLVKENLLISQRGPTGGFMLRRKPSDINLLEVYEAVEGRTTIPECPIDKPICPFDKCILGNITCKLSSEFQEFLRNQTLDKYL